MKGILPNLTSNSNSNFMKLPLYVRFSDPKDPEKPVRFRWYANHFDDTYILWDKETDTKVSIPTNYIREQSRDPRESDTQFVIRIVREALTRGVAKQLKSP